MTAIAPLYSDRWRVVGALALANIIGSLDMMFSTVALPTIASDFKLPLSGAAWIPLSGTLTIGALLLPSGSLADLLGRKRMQLSGIVLISVGSIIAAVAPSPAILIAARMVASAGVAIVFTQMMSVIAAVFPDSQRDKAIGAGIAASAVGMVIGPLAGGYVINSMGWRAAYWIIASLAIPVFIATAIIFVESRVSSPNVGKKIKFDWVGALLIAIGISLAVITLNEGNNQGWLSPLILGMAVLSIFILAMFVIWELRVQDPLFEIRHFADRLFRFAITVRFFAFFGYGAIWFVLPFIVQGIQGYGADVVGFVFFGGAAGMGVGALLAGRFEERRVLLSFLGLTLAAIANLLFFVALWMNLGPFMFAGANLLAGLGFGLWNTPVWAILLASSNKSSYSGAAAVMNLVRNTSQLFAVASATAIVTAIMMARGTGGDLSEIARDPTGSTGKAFVVGAQVVFILAGCFGIGTMFAIILARKPRTN